MRADILLALNVLEPELFLLELFETDPPEFKPPTPKPFAPEPLRAALPFLSLPSPPSPSPASLSARGFSSRWNDLMLASIQPTLVVTFPRAVPFSETSPVWATTSSSATAVWAAKSRSIERWL